MNCKDCRFYVPKFYQQGFCMRQFTPGSKILQPEAKEIFVHITFGCNQAEPIPPDSEGTI